MRRNRILSLLALIMAAIMLFTSCNTPDDGAIDFDPPLPYDPDDLGKTSAADDWAEYLVYETPEKTNAVTATQILKDLEFDAAPDIKGELIVVKETETTEKETYTITTTTEKWYAKDTGALVKSFTSVVPSVSSGAIPEDLDINKVVNYMISFNPNLNDYTDFIGVAKFTLALKEAEEDQDAPDPTLFESYESKKEIDYYYADGTPFLVGLTEMLKAREVNNASASAAGYYLIDCEENNKTYLIDGEGKVAFEFEYGKEYDVPVYEKGKLTISIDPENGNYVIYGYDYFEIGGKKYVITEESPEIKQIGELTYYIIPGITVTILDESNNVVTYYESAGDGVYGYTVLPGGNVFICEMDVLGKDAASYDFAEGEQKIDVTNKIVSATDGSVSVSDAAFVATNLLNANTKKMSTFTALNSMGMTGSTDVKEGFTISEIQKFQDGKLTGVTAYAVLNDNLEIVKELPKLIANQVSYPGTISANEIVVATKTANDKIVYYTVDTKSGKISLSLDLSDLVANVQRLTGGYFYNERVYDVNWNLLHDFRDDSDVDLATANFLVINGTLFYNVKYGESEIKTKRGDVVKSVYDGEDEYKFTTLDFLTNVDWNGEDMFIGIDSEGDYIYRNVEGENVIRDDRGVEYIYSETLGHDIMYRLTIDVQFIDGIDEDAGYKLALKTYTYEQGEYRGEDTGLEETFTKYELYIIK